MERSKHFQSRRHRHQHHHGHHCRTPDPGLPSELENRAHQSRQHMLPTPTPAPIREVDHNSHVESWLQQTFASALEHKKHSTDTVDARRTKTGIRKHGHAQSEDSSIIPSNLPCRTHIEGHHRTNMPEDRSSRDLSNCQKRGNKRKRSNSDAEYSIDKAPVQEEAVYRKRVRHKTREDKYKPYHGGPTRRKQAEDGSGVEQTHPGGSVKATEKGKEKKKKKRKGALTTARELMGKFSSEAIHNDRLTMPPSMRVGIFGNSKTGKTPGDLTFGQMAFLKEARPPDTMKIAPKSRSLESRKRYEKELENVEGFFSRKKQDGDETHQMNDSRHEKVSRTAQARDQTLDFVGPSSRATTYISWSSSDHPAERTIKDPTENKVDNLPNRSTEPRIPCPSVETPTPESVRQRLIETGIYRCLTSSDYRSSPGHVHEQKKPDPVPLKDRHDEIVAPKAAMSRASIAQQAYIKPQSILARGLSPEHAIPSTECPPSQVCSPLPDNPLGTQRPASEQHRPSSQDPKPKPKDIEASQLQCEVIYPQHLNKPLESLPTKYRYLPGSASMHSPDDSIGSRHLGVFIPPKPVSNLDNWPGLVSFRPHSSMSSTASLDHGRWPLRMRPYLRGQDQLSPSHPSPSSLISSTYMTSGVRPVRYENTHSGMVGRGSMREYITDLERTVLGVDDDENGRYRPPSADRRLEHEADSAAPTCVPGPTQTLGSTANFHAGNTMLWNSSAAQDHAYQRYAALPPTNPCINQGYETIIHDQVSNGDHTIHWHYAGEPTRPDSGMSGSGDTMARYWKPNTWGL